jgi:hypothetical protein
MYESPIKVIQGELETQLEGEILKAVHRVSVVVDRDELIQALRYDRKQYQKGFDDAKRDAVVVTRCKDCKHKGWVQEPCHGKSVDYCRVWDCTLRNLETTFCSHGEPKEE